MAQAPPSRVTKALLAGLAGGLVGSAAKVVAEKVFPPRVEGQTPPPKLVAQRTAAAADTALPPIAETLALGGMHWGFGTLTGGVYGLVAELYPQATAWRGAVFGLAVNRLMHKDILPHNKLVEPVPEQPIQERLSEWVTHVVYGVVTDSVRRSMLKRL